MQSKDKGVARSALRIVLVFAVLSTAWWLVFGTGRGASSGAVGVDVTPAEGKMPRALELYTPYCPSCRRMGEVVDEINARCASSGFRIVGVDISREENGQLADAYGVGTVPTLLFFDEMGAETARLVGVQSEERIERALTSAGIGSCGKEASNAAL